MKNVLILTALFASLSSCNFNRNSGNESARDIAAASIPSRQQEIAPEELNEILSFDPLTKYFWPLHNDGQTAFARVPGIAGNDLNMGHTILQRVEGKGVKIAISDTGIDVEHEDLKDNALQGEHRDYFAYTPQNGDPYPETKSSLDAHGTMVAGIISGISGNGIGSRGIAPKSNFAAFKFVGSPADSESQLDQASGDFDIFNYSYGAIQCKTTSVSMSYLKALGYQARAGRNGKGSIFVKAAGNEWSGLRKNCPRVPDNDSEKYYGNTNLEAENTTPYYIVVGATSAKGFTASYATPGSNIWVVAPGGEDGVREPGILTTDLTGCNAGRSAKPSDGEAPKNAFEYGHPLNPNCNYTARMNGSSAATPMVSGAVALMLEANPNLTWRDVKYILAMTAKKPEDSKYVSVHPNRRAILPEGYVYQEGWTKNNAGYTFHNWYGFGQVDVDSAVSMAKSYKSDMGEFKLAFNELNYKTNYISEPKISIPDFDAKGVTDSISVNHNLSIEGVQIKLNVEHTEARELAVELYSPAGTKSIIINGQNGIIDKSLQNIFIGTNAFYGEKSLGEWKIKVIDTKKGNDLGVLKYWSIYLFGHVENNTIDQTPPAPPVSISIDPNIKASIMKSPLFLWKASPSKDVMRYEIAVGSSEDENDVLDWVDIGNVTQIQVTLSQHKVKFERGSKYTFKFRAVDNWENTSLPMFYEWTAE